MNFVEPLPPAAFGCRDATYIAPIWDLIAKYLFYLLLPHQQP